jgi:hypothetical protein
VAEDLNGKELLPDSSIVLRSVEKIDNDWVVEAGGANAAACPDCGVVSSARHSNYKRHLKDLPHARTSGPNATGVGRWRCRNSGCQRQIFCETLSKVTHKLARETNRFSEVVQLVGYALGGRPGERLSSRLGFPVS